MVGLGNLPFKYRPAGESDILPVLIDNHNTNPEGINDINDALTIFQFLAKKFVVTTRVLSGHILHLKEFGKKDTVTDDRKHEGQEHTGSNLVHDEIIPNQVAAIALMLGTILVYALGGLDVYTMPKLALASIVLLYWAMTGSIGYSAAQPAIAAYLVALCVSTTFSDMPWLGVLGQSGSHSTGILPTILTIGAFQVGHNSGKDIPKWFILGALLCGCVALAQQVGISDPFYSEGGRAYGTMGNPVFCAGILAIGCVLPLAMGYRMVTALMFIALLTTNSRCGILAVGVGAFFVLAAKYRSKKIVWGIIVSCFVVGGIHTHLSLFRNHARSDSSRRMMAVAAVKAFMSAPLFGVGPEQFVAQMQKYRTKEYDDLNTKQVTSGHCHNALLESLMSTGIFGSITLAAIFTSILYGLYIGGNTTMIAVLLSVMAYSMVQPLVESMKIPIAVLVGSALPVDIKPSGYLRGMYVVVLAVVMITTLTMFRASRIMYAGAVFGNQDAFLKAYKYAAPNYERFVDREELRKSIEAPR